MKVIQPVAEIAELALTWKRQWLTVGLVPTMGFLHEGHASLIQRSTKDNDKTIVSIFLNPTQFSPSEDLEKYPRNLERDLELCRGLDVDAVFQPSAADMYPPPYNTYIEVERITSVLCGQSRPSHFRGVATVVCKLLNIISPDYAYFGQKDAQQFAVVRQMTRDLNMRSVIVACPIIREEDGLAKSSRNVYLRPEERAAAPVLYKSLEAAREAIAAGRRETRDLLNIVRGTLKREPLANVDYIEIVDVQTLQPMLTLQGTVLIAIAVFFGKTRLIDNIEITI